MDKEVMIHRWLEKNLGEAAFTLYATHNIQWKTASRALERSPPISKGNGVVLIMEKGFSVRFCF